MTNQTEKPRVEFTGDPDFPIWLLGDSPSDSPSAKDQDLTPLDPRHPTRHSIWTPIQDVIQRQLYVECGRRMDDSKLYIRNAVRNSYYKLKTPKNRVDKEYFNNNRTLFEAKQKEAFIELRELLNRDNKPKPLLILCFGQFVFEFASRTQEYKQGDEIEVLQPQVWEKKQGIQNLRKAFDKNIEKVELGEVTLIPLLHASAAVSFQFASQDFSGGGNNYFEYVGEKIASVLITKVLFANHPDHRLDKLWLPA